VAVLGFRVLIFCGFLVMADEDELDDEMEGEDGEDLDGEGGEDSEKSGGTKKILIIVAVFLLLVVGGFAGAYFTGLLDPVIAWITGGEVEKNPEEEKKEASINAVFFPLEEIIVNLNTGGRKSTFLKVKVNLELADAGDIKRIEAVMPRIMDNFQVYLRELRIEDLKGSAGMYRLREELLTRVNLAAAPAKVNDVLFKEMLVQ
jgi:flagellar FliL protein